MDVDDNPHQHQPPAAATARAGGKRKLPTAAAAATDAGGRRGGKRAKRSAASVHYRPNPLDATCVHPESYAAAGHLLTRLGVRADSPDLPAACRRLLDGGCVGASSNVVDADDRRLLELLAAGGGGPSEAGPTGGPLFLSGVTGLASLSAGQSVAGVVKNVAEFGAFCDIGCTCSALLHVSRYPADPAARRSLHLGARFRAVVDSVDPTREEIRLRDMQFC